MLEEEQTTVAAAAALDEGDAISLTLPARARYASVARIVVGGLAARLNLSYESLDDLQLAVESILAEERLATEATVTLDLRITDETLTIDVGPIEPSAARAALERTDPVALRVVLAAVVDRVEVVEEGSSGRLRLEKAVPVLPRD